MKAARQFACAGQALAGSKVVAQDSEHDLRNQLFANRNFTASGKPELHSGQHHKLGRAAKKVVIALSRRNCRFCATAV